MLDTKKFAEKLKNHRKNLGMTQEEVAESIGVSPQAVSKWESGDCLPDCFNLKSLGEVYGVSLDILLETETSEDIDRVAGKIEQLGDEFIWAKSDRNKPNAHHDLGDDLWKMWKGLYFIETGDKASQEKSKREASYRVCSEYGMKVWDDDGIACIVRSGLREKLDMIGERELEILRELCSPDGIRLIGMLDTNRLTTKAELVEKRGIELARLNELLLLLSEAMVVEFVQEGDRGGFRKAGYKICARVGISAYMVLAAAYLLAKKNCTISEYIRYGEE